MTLLEKLKELSATTGRRNGNEDLRHWAYREKHENAWVRDIALPALIAVAEAAKRYVDDDSQESARLYADVVVALAKLEVEQNV